MSNCVIYYKDLTKEEWNAYLMQSPESGYLQSWGLINYFSKFSNIVENLSFVLLDEDKSLKAICPFAVSFNPEQQYYEASFGGNPFGTPALAELKPSARRKVLDEVLDIIRTAVQKHQVKKIIMLWDPLVEDFCRNNASHKNHFELLRYQMLYSVENIVAIKLDHSEEVLFDNVSKYQRRHIRQTEKKGIVIKILNTRNHISEIGDCFSLFQAAHFKSAGRLTRPLETWEAMKGSLLAGEATLFVAFLGDIPISYLFCGEFGKMSFGWAQVNDDEFETEYSPRHLLEWKAILFYKQERFSYYEVGERYYGSQLFHATTPKEMSISVFKERYGGVLLPKIKWTGYCNLETMNLEYKIAVDTFITSEPMFKIPEIK